MDSKDYYKWNKAFNFVMELKETYHKEFNILEKTKFTPSNSFGNILEEMAIELKLLKGIDKYYEIIKHLQINQKDNLVLLRYGNYTANIDGEEEVLISPWNPDFWDIYDGIYRECRSVVIDIKREKIVLAPFSKFMNLNQTEEYSEENIRKRLAKAYEENKPVEITTKIDGSMQCFSYDIEADEIFCSGSQSLDPSNSWRLLDGCKMFYSDSKLLDMVHLHPSYTFIFEYVSIKDAHVVRYTKEQEGLYLLGMRNNLTGELLSYKKVIETGKRYGIKFTTDLHCESFDDVLNDLDKYSSDEAEGVVLNIDGFLVKIKYDDYVIMHKVLSCLRSPNTLVRGVADGTVDDILSKIPSNYLPRAMAIVNLIRKYCSEMDREVNEIYDECMRNTGNTKDFMIYVNINFPKKYRKFVVNKYKNKENNYLKSLTHTPTPHYCSFKDLGLEKELEEILEKYE